MKKIGLLVLAVVFAVGALGVGYAMWDEEVFIDGEVNTGEVNAGFTMAFTDDDGVEDDPAIDSGDDGGGTLYDHNGAASSDDPIETGPDPDRSDKDVGMSSAEIDSVDPQAASLTIENGYPCYHTTAYFEITNTGTIPVKVQGKMERANIPHLVSWDGGSTWAPMPANTWYAAPFCTIKLVDLDGNGLADFAIHNMILAAMDIGEQIDPGESVKWGVDMHIEQDFEELGSFTFEEKIQLVQWNEYEP
jgi:hypothetical protein